MALVVKDRVKETTATTGTGTLTLAGALTGFQSFSSALSDGDTTYYAIFESSTGEWEVGLGTFTASGTTLARTTILASSNSGSAVNLTAGAADVFITQPATKAAYFDGSGDLVLNQDPTANLQAATKQYVDTIAAAGLHYHAPVRVEHPSNLTATYDNGASGVGATLTNSGTQAALVLDNVTMVLNDRVLIANQTNQAHNGVYTVTNVGSASTNWVLTRATDADSYGPSDPDALGEGDAFFIKEGDTNAGHLDVMTTSGTITFGTTDIVFSEVAETTVYSAGNGLTLTGTTFAVGAGTGVTVNANDVAIGQAVGTSDTVTFATVNANLTGNVTGNLTGNVTGNADTATAWATGRTISLTGDITGSATGVDGSGNVSIATTYNNDVVLGTDTSGNYVSTGAVSGNGLSGSASAEGATFTVTSNATNANTASTIVFRDASGNFSAGTITANLTGTASSATNADTVDSLHASQFLRSDTADSTASTISFTGDIEVGDQIFHHGDTDTYLQFVGGNDFRIVTGNTEQFSANSTNGIEIPDKIVHTGDTDTYMQFHAANQWRVVTGGTEMLEVNDSNIIMSSSVDINGSINGVENIYLANYLYHEGDTDTYLGFGTNTINLVTGNSTSATFNSSGIFVTDGSVAEDYDALSGTTPTCNVDNGGMFSLTMTGNTTFTFSGASSGYVQGFVLQLTGNGSTVTYPASVDWAGGTAPDAPASGETDILVFITRDGGTTWYGVRAIDAAA